MLIFYERIDSGGKKVAGALDVVDLESFADQMIEFLSEGSSSIVILQIDKDGGIVYDKLLEGSIMKLSKNDKRFGFIAVCVSTSIGLAIYTIFEVIGHWFGIK